MGILIKAVSLNSHLGVLHSISCYRVPSRIKNLCIKGAPLYFILNDLPLRDTGLSFILEAPLYFIFVVPRLLNWFSAFQPLFCLFPCSKVTLHC